VDGDDEDTGDEGAAAPPSRQRSRSGSLTAAPYHSGKAKKKEYRSQDMKRKQDDVPTLSPLGSPTGLRSPRYTSPLGSSTNLAESTPRPALYKPVQRPSAVQRGGSEQRLTPMSVTRAISSDNSSPSSAGPPISPSDSRPIRRAGGRVWDPARGVEIFKKGSEEVLSRFLKLGSWEDEKQSQSPT